MDAGLYKIKLKTKNKDKIYEWFKGCQNRISEYLEGLEKEGTFVESVFLDEDENGDLFLIYYMKANDVKKAIEIFKKSTSPIDVFYMENWNKYCSESIVEFEKLFDVDRIEK